MTAEATVSGERQNKWITISLEEYESMQRTIEVLSDKELMEQLRESKKDKESGKIRSFNEVARELGL